MKGIINQKQEQLKINPSTASGQLRQKIMFMLVQKSGLDVCYRCNQKISEVKDFSIDHKVDWLYSSDPVFLFFDVNNNIVFSHKKCNYAKSGPSRVLNNKYGYKGIYLSQDEKRSKPWYTCISVKNKIIKGKHFSTKEGAAREYDRLALLHRGSLAVTNQMLGLLK